MLHITILSIGKTNESYVREGLDKYMKLLSKYCKPECVELPDVKNANKLPPEKLKEAEAALIESQLPDKAAIIFLDETGKTYTSEKFAAYLTKKTLESSKLVFVIGGSYGLAESVKRRGEAISLSEMTFNHQMVRVILAEQIFRAFTIIKGTGYHH
ncbi:MAG: 23S rRNA (pseudouridine(1915)-N(3))-methyltransferase RlmH [Chitinophagaceae bacterium]